MRPTPVSLDGEPSVVRAAEPSEADHLAQVWYQSWKDAHWDLLPDALKRVRTPESFRERMAAGIARVRTIGPRGAPVGFYMLKHDELDQLFVSAAARGTGAAAALIEDAEARLAEQGTRTAWLACAIGNHRAARFYEKHGWTRAGTMVSQHPTPEGTVSLEVWRYEKPLA